MPHTLTVTLSLLACTLVSSISSAEDQAGAPQCDPATGICTDGTASAPAAGGKQIWAHSRLYTDAPPLEVLKWLTDKPELDGKVVIIEFWRTWCGACKRMTPLMNTLHKKFGSELAVIGITGESEEKVRAYAGPKKAYYLALDLPQAVKETTPEEQAAATKAENEPIAALPDQASGPAANRPGQGRYEAQFGVWGWPHVMILEPLHHTIVWEGFTGLKGYELTEAKVAKILAVSRAMKAEEAAARKK